MEKNNASSLSDFTNLYSLSKTLRFELKPQGKTADFIAREGFFLEDKKREEDYKIVKEVADRYHKHFINRILSNYAFKLNGNKKESLIEFQNSYKNGKDDKENLNIIANNLRKQIVSAFKNDDIFKILNKKDFIETVLPSFETDSDKLRALFAFKGFTTYFNGYNKARQNLYSAEDKHGTIAHRLINENLPIFIKNIESFKKISNSKISESFPIITESFQLSTDSISEFFNLSYFNSVLTQTQIELYNTIIGGLVNEDGSKVCGINEYVNLYNQQNKIDKSKRLPFLKPLYKQLLCDRDSASWLPEQFNNDSIMFNAIKEHFKIISEHIIDKTDKNPITIETLLTNISDYDINKIYITYGAELNTISKKHLGSWDTIQNAIRENYIAIHPKKEKEKLEKFIERIEKYEKKLNNVSLADINNLIINNEKNILDYFKASNLNNLIEQIRKNYDTVFMLCSIEDIFKNDRSNAISLIKNLLDSLKELQFFIKPLICDLYDKDEEFYGILLSHWELLNSTLNPLYNKVRNYITRKPYSTKKIKLNFQNQTLLNGWAKSKEEDNTSVIFRKNNKYYLGIMNKKHNKIFREIPQFSDGEFYEKMEYQLLPGANKMLPKVFFSEKNISYFAPSHTLMDNYKNDTHKKGENFNLNHCHNLIDFFKDSINKHEDWVKFGFKFSNTETYADLSNFYKEVEQQGYKLQFLNISAKYIDSLVDEGKLYLFQIYNKDFSEYSKGKPNLHTIYWRAIFDQNNLNNIVYKLNGEAEIFYREKSLAYNDDIKTRGHHYENLKEKFDYPIIKDRRYSLDKFLFHVPITINFKSHGINNINYLVEKLIKNRGVDHIIGIDRGERHLLYICLIDINGNIKQQFSLNTIVNNYKEKEYCTDYLKLLNEKGNRRRDERKSWTEIETIKELKEGYISQVIHKIVQLIIDNNAIVVMEDLNMGFKRMRQKVESSVYQKFEKMLIDKLNYIVNKGTPHSNAGGALNAYQFANKFESFNKVGKQNGFIFYVPAWNTSNIDPTTGFVNLLNTKYENIEKTKKFIDNIETIHYNTTDETFEFNIDYLKFNVGTVCKKTKWTICTYGKRINNFRDTKNNYQWTYETVILTNEFKKLFVSNGIDINGNIKDAIGNLAESKSHFYKTFMHLLRLTLQMRNSNPNEGLDYIISPIKNIKGEFFDSSKNDYSLPENADANGAYNIALKGLWAIEQIKANDSNKATKVAISNKEWLEFAQRRNSKNNDY